MEGTEGTDALLAAADPGQPVLASICAAYVEVNDYSAADLPMLRQRMALILREPALQAHSQVRYADVDRVVAGIEAAVDRVAPGFRDLVLARSVQGPPDLERTDPALVGGSINGGTAAIQLVIVLVSESVALLADTIHNFADASTAMPSSFILRVSSPMIQLLAALAFPEADAAASK